MPAGSRTWHEEPEDIPAVRERDAPVCGSGDSQRLGPVFRPFRAKLAKK